MYVTLSLTAYPAPEKNYCHLGLENLHVFNLFPYFKRDLVLLTVMFTYLLKVCLDYCLSSRSRRAGSDRMLSVCDIPLSCYKALISGSPFVACFELARRTREARSNIQAPHIASNQTPLLPLNRTMRVQTNTRALMKTT